MPLLRLEDIAAAGVADVVGLGISMPLRFPGVIVVKMFDAFIEDLFGVFLDIFGAGFLASIYQR